MLLPEGASGPTELLLSAAPGVRAEATLLLKNLSGLPWAVHKVALVPASPHLRAEWIKSEDWVPSGATARLQLRYRPVEAATQGVQVAVCLVRRAHGEGHAAPRRILTCLVRLLCVDPASAPELRALAPTSPYQRPRPARRDDAAEVEDAPPPQDRYRLGESWSPGRVAMGAVAAQLEAREGSPLRNALMRSLLPPLTAANHAERFRLLLLCEEVAARADMRAFDLSGVRLRAAPGQRLLQLDVPGLAESRPSVTRGDAVVLWRAGAPLAFRGVVEQVALTTLSLRLSAGFHAACAASAEPWNVRFELRRAPYLVQHAAVAGAGAEPARAAQLLPGALSPAAAALAAAGALATELPAPLHSPDLNERQVAAVRGALYAPAPAGSAQLPRPPFIVFGPPGTGKTRTLVEYVQQVVAGARARGLAPGAPAGGWRWQGRPPPPSGLLARMSALALAPPPPLPPPPQAPPEVCLLLVAPSNAAVDLLALRLLGAPGGLSPSQLLRCNAFQRERASLPPALAPCSRYDDAQGGFALPNRAALARVWVVAATCCTAQRLVRQLEVEEAARRGRGAAPAAPLPPLFTHVVIDEAGQATEPEALCALAGALRPPGPGGHSVGRLVLAGDPEQLGPVLRSGLAAAMGLGTSLLERLMRAPEGPHAHEAGRGWPGGLHPAFAVQLTRNYRSHPAILAVPNALFYESSLLPMGAGGGDAAAAALGSWPGLTPAARRVPGGFPLLFHGVQGTDAREGNSPSWFNAEEAVAVANHAESILRHSRGAISAADIGIVTPYHKQVQKLRQILRGRPGCAGIVVGSVELFQGAERAVIIVSTVRSSRELIPFDERHALGFLTNPKRFNVAVTRAQSLLVIVGNPAVLALDECWSALLRYTVAHGAYAGCALPPGLDGGGAAPDFLAEEEEEGADREEGEEQLPFMGGEE